MGPEVALCHQVRVTSPSAALSSPPALHAVREASAMPAAAANVTSRVVLRLFIIEPLESFGLCAESDLDVLSIRMHRYAVKRNIFGVAETLWRRPRT